jgi:hypothetical protein
LKTIAMRVSACVDIKPLCYVFPGTPFAVPHCGSDVQRPQGGGGVTKKLVDLLVDVLDEGKFGR